MIPTDADRGTSPRPSPSGLGGSADPEATGAYLPAGGPPPASARSDCQSAGPSRFDFLGPPRVEGDLGWLAHYRVRNLVGEGAIGLVFRALDTQLSRPVALKVIKPEKAGAPEVRGRFVREAQATAAIKHDNIVTIYQVGRDKDTLFLAMEYLQGISLQNWLERRRKPSIDLVLRIGREVAAGLAAAHRRGLIHRDIKPANIWLEAPSGRAKILDFGMVRSERESVQITHTGTVVGTPAYMAPEQARGEAAGASSDLFSLGCVLYRLCTGRSPFEGETILAVLSALSSDTPLSLRQVEPDVLPALDELVMRLLAKAPAARPASAAAVVEAIKAIERDLLAQRQDVELLDVAPLPEDVATTKPAKPGSADGPGQPAGARRSRGARRALWIAAVLIVTATAGMGLYLVPTGQRLPATVAGRNAPVPPADEPAGEGTMPAKIERPVPSQPRAIAEDHAQEAERPAGPERLSALSSGASTVTAPAVPDRAPGGAGTVDRPAEARPTAPKPSKEMKIGDAPPQPERAEPKGLPGALTKADRQRQDWGEAIDPDRDCKIDLDRPENRVRIFVPTTPHLLSAELARLNAPRLLKEAKGDFDARVVVAGVFQPAGKSTVKEYSPYHGAGILLWQDEENYVRLEIAADLQHGKPRPYANFEYRKDGALAVSQGLKIVYSSSHLRLKRRGDEIYAAFGPDGVRWTSFPPLAAKLKDRLRVGVAAINTSSKPLNAEFEGFEISAKPEGQQ